MDGSRRRVRRDWPVRRFNLGEEPSDDLSATTTAAERLAMMWSMTLDAWACSGQPLPQYTRDRTPVRRRSLDDRV